MSIFDVFNLTSIRVDSRPFTCPRAQISAPGRNDGPGFSGCEPKGRATMAPCPSSGRSSSAGAAVTGAEHLPRRARPVRNVEARPAKPIIGSALTRVAGGGRERSDGSDGFGNGRQKSLFVSGVPGGEVIPVGAVGAQSYWPLSRPTGTRGPAVPRRPEGSGSRAARAVSGGKAASLPCVAVSEAESIQDESQHEVRLIMPSYHSYLLQRDFLIVAHL